LMTLARGKVAQKTLWTATLIHAAHSRVGRSLTPRTLSWCC